MFFRKSRNEKIAIEISRGLFSDFENFIVGLISNYRKYDEIPTQSENRIIVESLTLFLWLVKVDQSLPIDIHESVVKNIHFLYYDYLSKVGISDEEIEIFNSQ